MTQRENVCSSKVCEGCGREKTADAFLPSRFSSDGLTDNCRACVFDRSSADRVRREGIQVSARRSSRPTRRRPSVGGA